MKDRVGAGRGDGRAAAVGESVGRRPEAPVVRVVGDFAGFARFEKEIVGRVEGLAGFVERRYLIAPAGEPPVHVWIAIVSGPRLDPDAGAGVFAAAPADVAPHGRLAEVDKRADVRCLVRVAHAIDLQFADPQGLGRRAVEQQAHAAGEGRRKAHVYGVLHVFGQLKHELAAKTSGTIPGYVVFFLHAQIGGYIELVGIEAALSGDDPHPVDKEQAAEVHGDAPRLQVALAGESALNALHPFPERRPIGVDHVLGEIGDGIARDPAHPHVRPPAPVGAGEGDIGRGRQKDRPQRSGGECPSVEALFLRKVAPRQLMEIHAGLAWSGYVLAAEAVNLHGPALSGREGREPEGGRE